MKYFKLFEEYTVTNKNIRSASEPYITDGGPKDIYSYDSSLMKMSSEDLQTLKDYDIRYGEVYDMRDLDRGRMVLNIEEEKKKFYNARDRDEEYNPIWKHNPPEYKKNGSLQKTEDLIKDFKKFDCYLSQFYLEKLYYLKSYMNAMYMDRNTKEYQKVIYDMWTLPSIDLVDEAIRINKENPYEDVPDKDRTIDAKEMKVRMETVLKELGYDKWKVYITDTITPRMNIKDEYKVNINSNATFNEDDVKGLIGHEIKGHVGRRYYGDKTGLILFRNGLDGKNSMDEGIAIYNSLQEKKPKPNILFNISLYAIMANQLDKLTFAELYDFCKKYETDDDILWKKTVRIKRYCTDTSKLVGDAYEGDYLDGYLKVNNMTNSQRELLLKFQVGAKQTNSIPKIKNFLEVNGFIDKDF